MNELLEKLSRARGVAGHEGEVRAILREELAAHVEALTVDSIGNLIMRKGGSSAEGTHRVMLAAHMDEVGGMVMRTNTDGTVKFRSVGGLDPRILPGKRVRIGAQSVPGVIMRAPHAARSGKRVVPTSDLLIDTGGAGGIEPGDMITFESEYEEYGRLLKAKSFDDRVGCYILAELMKGDFPCELVGAFTVQEEIGLRGAGVAAYAVEPDVAVALEGTVADDLPKQDDVSPTTELGKGPSISVMDRSAHADRRLVRILTETATAHDIPWQFKQPGVGGTDVGTIHLARGGVPAVAVAVPCRYIHTPAALMDPADVNRTIELMSKALSGPLGRPLEAEWSEA
ncbi:MAG: M42 family metallopeptidase [Caldilineaceae bacterium SB0675_bin_29]|uniref:M42 family metallopeptidase n=1 Tax=Caldilineaceae bacterium SB0675_bin_29 TaxID=2605266 RepID=A0A6B1G389_9CHLR|nr:M42 family metallopeptidase [Caldilineaceae bacterium SB0675_bin_29]